MENNKELVVIENRKRTVKGQFNVYNDDPRFYLAVDDDLLNRSNLGALGFRGDYLVLNPDSENEERRVIIGATSEYSILGGALIFLAPRQFTEPNLEAEYLKFDKVELRPGATFIGGRNSGFYDDEGIILAAQHVGGDPKRFEDWAYYVLGKSDFGDVAPQWILLDDIGVATAAPTSIIDFDVKPSKPLDDLLASGERELFEYFARHPDRIGELNPKQFEQLVQAIYKNLGFTTEPIGSWNQGDGGVDIIALNKTLTGVEFRLAIQCKTSKNKISAKPIRELAGVLDAFKAHQGIVVTTSEFTSSAKNETEGHLWKIKLQDRDDLVRRIISIVMPQFKWNIDNIENL